MMDSKLGYILIGLGVVIALVLGIVNTMQINDIKDDQSQIEERVEKVSKDVDKAAKKADKRMDLDKLRRREKVQKRGKMSLNLPVTLGNADAPVTLVEFSDYQCPFCGKFYRDSLPKIVEDYIDTGKVRYYFRHYPLRFHRQAHLAAQATECAGEDGKFWEMHNKLFDNQRNISKESITKFALELGLKEEPFSACLEEERYKSKVDKDLNDGMKVGIRGTPGFFIGRTGDGDEVEGKVHSGAQPFSFFKKEIEELLE